MNATVVRECDHLTAVHRLLHCGGVRASGLDVESHALLWRGEDIAVTLPTPTAGFGFTVVQLAPPSLVS